MPQINVSRVIVGMGAIAAIALAALAPLPRASVAQAAGDCTVDASLDSEERAFATLINNYRAQNGLAPLAVSYLLTKPSQWKSGDMAANDYFAHDDLSRTWVDRIRDCGYGYNTWLGENIAAGYQSAQAVFDAWRNSPGHNANMLGTNYTAIGIGRAYDASSPYGWYWTTDFGGVSDGFVWATEGPEPIVAPAATANSSAESVDVAARAKPPDGHASVGKRHGHGRKADRAHATTSAFDEARARNALALR
jgi:uncharacterized protein YkwD